MTSTKSSADDVRLLYFVDPMCSWCWGFAPVVSELSKRLPLDIIAGGLRVHETRPMTGDVRDMIQGHWRKVAELTGQPFRFEGSLPNDFIYNSGPACCALVAVRELAPHKTLQWLHRLQQAFYAEAVDITSTGELVRLAAELDIEGFGAAFASEQNKEATEADYDRRYESAVTGFPTLLLQRDGRLKRVCYGYMSLPDIVARLDELGVVS